MNSTASLKASATLHAVKQESVYVLRPANQGGNCSGILTAIDEVNHKCRVEVNGEIGDYPMGNVQRRAPLPFHLSVVTATGQHRTRTVSYPAGTSPREVAEHQSARNGYAQVTATRAYANPFGTLNSVNGFTVIR